MRAVDAQSAAQKWAENLANSTQRVQAGVEAVTVSPGVAAARQMNLWVQNTQAAAQKFAKNSAAVSTASWQSAMINKGLPRIASGAQAAQPKMEAFMGQFLPFLSQAVKGLPPRGTFAQNLARSQAMITAIHNSFSYNKVSG